MPALAVGAALGAGVELAAGGAAEHVTLAVRPTIVSGIEFGKATAFGTVSNGRAGETVRLEVRECGAPAFRVDSGPGFNGTTAEGGAFGGDVWVPINTVVRARWKDTLSEPVEIKRRATVQLRQRGGRRFEVVVWAVRYFEGKRARIDRWNGRSWVAARHVTLRRGIAGDVLGSEGDARIRVGSGVQLRAVLPGSQARPCYVEGVSRIIKSR